MSPVPSATWRRIGPLHGGRLVATAGIVALLFLALSRAARPRTAWRMGNDVAVALGLLGVLAGEIRSSRTWGTHRPILQDFRPNAER